MLSALLAALLLTASAEPPPATGLLTRAPFVTDFVEPDYPPDAAASGQTAEVTLELDVSETGQVTAARVLQGAGEAFDLSAARAATKMRFSPAEIDGKPAAVRLEYRFTFALKPPPAVPPAETTESRGSAPPKAAPVVNFRGRILQRGTRAPIVGATLELGEGTATAVSDAEGRFELAEVPLGSIRARVVADGFQRFETTETVEAGKLTEVTYYLRQSSSGGFETVVVGQREKKDVAFVSLSVGEIRQLPGASGDTLRVVESLPGVARTGYGSGTLVLRGGDPSQTRVYIDGVNVPLIFHFGGINSVYSSELVQDLEYEPGNFGVRYGRAIAGRVELKSRDPNPKQMHAVARFDLLDAQVMAEGPLSENVTAAIALRRAYIDGVINLALAAADEDNLFSVAPRYYDYQGKLVWKLGGKDTLRFDLFGADDGMALVGLDLGGLEDYDALSLRTSFLDASASWEHRFDPGTRLQLRLSQGFLMFAASAGPVQEQDKWWTSSLRGELSHEVSSTLTLAAGVDAEALPAARFEVEAPPIPAPNEVPSPDDPARRFQQTERVFEPALWLEATWKPWTRLSVIPGVRVDYSSYIEEAWVDPRLSARLALGEKTTLKGGAGVYHQAPRFVYVTEEWGNPDLGTEGARQYSFGVERKLLGPVSVDAQVYYKDLFGQTVPSTRVIERDGRMQSERYSNEGTGRAYGSELLVRYAPDGRFFGWVSYSLSRTERDQHTVGGRLDATGDQFDQPHNLVALGSLEIPEVWDGLSVGFRLRFTSGNPERRMNGVVYDVDRDAFLGLPEAERNLRMPNFFQLDLRVDKKWTYPTWTLAAFLDVQNATNRQNVEGTLYSHDYSEKQRVSGLPIFPSFGVRAEY